MKPAFYLTADDVNGSLAEQLARRDGVELQILSPSEPLPPQGVLICDWDDLGDEAREGVLSHASPELLLVLHSYGLDFERQRHLVWPQQIVVYRRLDSRLFAEFGLAAVAAV